MPFINDMLAERKPPATTAVTPARFLFDPDAAMARLRANIVGQDAALECIATALRVVKADIGEPRRPRYVALLMGPTGVGKTETVRLLAETIHGNADHLCRIDMNTLSQDHYSAALTGAPPGYVGSREGTTLFDEEKIRGSFSRPGIVLFDEVEKASQEVLRALLGVFDNGRLTLTSGAKTLDFRNSLVFMTSNLGADAIQRYERSRRHGWRRYWPTSEADRNRQHQRLLERALEKRFDPEFINRIDRVVHYHTLGQDQSRALVDRELEKLNQRLRARGCVLELDDDSYALLQRCGWDHRFGARAMARAFRHEVEAGLADCLIALPPTSAGHRIGATVSDNHLQFRIL